MKHITKDDIGKHLVGDFSGSIFSGHIRLLNNKYMCGPWFLLDRDTGEVQEDFTFYFIDGVPLDKDLNKSTIEKNRGCSNCSLNLNNSCFGGFEDRKNNWKRHSKKTKKSLPMPCHFILKPYKNG